MIRHSLIIRRLINKTVAFNSVPKVLVSVISDTWSYDKGRAIEFIGMGLPNTFTFVALSTDQPDNEGQLNGDSRAGSWAAYATKIGANRYQAVQPTGLELEPTGVAIFGDYNSNVFSTTGYDISQFGQTAASPMGINTDWALARAQCPDVVFGIINSRVNRPLWGRPDPLPARFQVLAYGSAFDKNTRSIQSGASTVRKGMYDFNGTVVSTNFYPRTSPEIVGGCTFMPVNTLTDSTSINFIFRETAMPVMSGGLSETDGGAGRVTPSKLYVLVYTETIRPYKTWEFRLGINDDGSFVFENRGPNQPGSNGYNTASEATALFTSNPDDVLDNADNRATLKGMYFNALARQFSYTMHYPIAIPNNFKVYVGTTTMANNTIGWQLTDTWVTYADFINHDYTIGG